MKTIVLLLVLVASSPVGAQPAEALPPPAPVAVAATPDPTVSITFSPFHLILPMGEVEVEYRAMPHAGLALIGGLGRVSSMGITGTATELGGQFNYYLLRSFTGLHAGIELMYLHLGDVDIDSSVSAAGTTAGPYIGYKVATEIGLTLIAQAGIDFIVANASSSTTMQSVTQRSVFPLVNLNAGWSF